MNPDTWLLISPLLVALAAGVAVIVLDAMDRTRLGVWAGVLLLLGAAVAAAAIGWAYEATTVFGPSLVVGSVASYAVAFVMLLSALVLAGGSDHFASVPSGGPLAALVCFSALAAAVLATSHDLLVTILALETSALAGYAFVAGAGTRRSDEGAMKYVVQGAVATGMLLLGATALYGAFGGALTYGSLNLYLQPDFVGATPRVALLGMAGVLAAFAFKLSGFPFHAWAPDAFETADPAPGAALASVPKVAAVLASVTLFGGVMGAVSAHWVWMVVSIAVASIVVGNVAGLRQTSYTRMLAYSGIAQAGYAFAGFAGFEYTVFGVRLFALGYALAVAGAFLAAQSVRDEDPGWDGTIAGLAGLATSRPILAAALSVCLLSLTGIPLTLGFWGKFWAFLVVSDAGWTWLAYVGFLGSVVSFGYYGAVIRAMYLERGSADAVADPGGDAGQDEAAAAGGGADGEDAPGAIRPAAASVVVIALVVLTGGLYPLVAGFEGFFTVIGI